MTSLVLDAGALISLDRNDRGTWALLGVAADDAAAVFAPAGAIAQAWRDGTRQALLSRALAHCDEVILDGVGARAAGALCGRAATSDIIDASVALAAAGAARHGGPVSVATSDPADIRRLLDALGVTVHIVTV